jgi:hypothetical protein
MRFSGFRAAAKSKRAMVGGAVLALSLAGFGMTNAAAAASWSAETQGSTDFTCLSNCQAGGVGAVADGDVVGPSSTGQPGGGAIGAWTRTVHIECKADTVASGREYHGTVVDKNWSGEWSFLRASLTTSIDDGNIPSC